jgi:hypothetical protein
MLKKGILTLFVVALGIFAFGLANADQIDSLGSGTEPFAPPTDLYVNPGGLGDALIYGYYNVRDNRDNYFNVVNTDVSNGVRARIRFIEAADVDSECKGSIEVLDFDICLTPGDVWTGVIRNANDVATLYSPDDDTYIDIGEQRGLNSVIFADNFPGGVAFRTDPIVPNVSAAMTMEGYFIVIAENVLSEVVSGGNCGPNLNDNLTQVDNVLFGINYAVDMDNLATNAYNALSIGDFSSIPFPQVPVAANPNLGDAFPDGLIGLNYALTKSNLYSTYDLEADIAGKTSMVVNFPTRRLTCNPTAADIFDDDRVLITVWDDEENSPLTTCEFSPCPPGLDVSLPHEVNVIDLNNSEIFTSMVEVPLTISFEYGWLNIDLTQANPTTPAISPAHVTSFGGYNSYGLPAIGYTAIDIAGGQSTHMLPMQYSSDVELD